MLIVWKQNLFLPTLGDYHYRKENKNKKAILSEMSTNHKSSNWNSWRFLGKLNNEEVQASAGSPQCSSSSVTFCLLLCPGPSLVYLTVWKKGKPIEKQQQGLFLTKITTSLLVIITVVIIANIYRMCKPEYKLWYLSFSLKIVSLQLYFLVAIFCCTTSTCSPQILTGEPILSLVTHKQA